MGRALGLIFAQAFDLPRKDEIFVAAERDAVLGGKAFGALRDKINMRAVTQDFAGGADRVAQTLHTTDAAAPEGRAIHDESVELHFTVAIQKTAATGVEGL